MSERPRGTWARFAVKLAVLGCLPAGWYVTRSRPPDCEHASQGGEAGLALVICQQEYERTHEPRTGALLANALRRNEDRATASRLAERLLTTSAQSDALTVLGKIATTEERYAEAIRLLQDARSLHIVEQRGGEIARDEQALAAVHFRTKRFDEALRALDACITLSARAKDRQLEGYCHMTAGFVLTDVGYADGAETELTAAELLLTQDVALADMARTRGRLYQGWGIGPKHRGGNGLAVREFERAIERASTAALTRLRRGAELDLAYSLAELDRVADAAHHLEVARQLDIKNEDELARALLEARIAYHRGDYALATSINTRIYDRLTDSDDKLRVCVMQAQIGLALNTLDSAIAWAERGVLVAEEVRGAQVAIELRPWVLAMRRQPHELLFTALAQTRRFEEAIAVFDQWQGRTLLDAIARGKSKQPADLRTAAIQTQALQHLVPVLSQAPIMRPTDRKALLTSLAGADLVAVVVAHDEVWRITSRHGDIDIVGLGALAALRGTLDQFIATPLKTALSDALGERLLGRDAFDSSEETLFVLLDAQLAGVPVAALSDGGVRIIARRPVVQPARLSELGCIPARTGRQRAVVLGDAHGNLPAARSEAVDVAARFGVTAKLGQAATSEALFSAWGSDLLHIGVHAGVEAAGGALALRDRSVSALQIATHDGGPKLVMLAACDSATADDGELATSLAAAFLASGSQQVIGTLRQVNDKGARELTSEFYRLGGTTDPARVLAQVQAALAKTANNDWPNFIMFGYDNCRGD